MGFVFYDSETTGTDTYFDQILQFAAVHTDFQFNELDRFEVRCRLLPHVVPNPGAMKVTKVRAAQLFDHALLSHYQMACEIRRKLLAWSPALFIGYNSIDFDEHLLRQTFYKTLHPPYLTNSKGNSRSDALRIVRAASLFAPDALIIPVDHDGEQVFKLDKVAPQNGFAHERAHDAIADVEATIFLCRILAEKAPDVWSSFMRFSQKAAVADHLASERVFSFSEFYFGKPYSWLVTPIGRHPEINSEHYVFDLAIDPDGLRDYSEDQLIGRLRRTPKPVRRLKSNNCPLIMPVEDAPFIAVAVSLGPDEVNRRANGLHADPDFCDRLVQALLASKEEYPPSIHIERQLYDGFSPPEDEVLMERFHLAPWEERLAIVSRFKDQRLNKLGRQLIHIERPDLLDDCATHDQAVAIRLTGADPDNPWLTLPEAITKIEELLVAAGSEEADFFKEHHSHLSERLTQAMQILSQPAAVG